MGWKTLKIINFYGLLLWNNVFIFISFDLAFLFAFFFFACIGLILQNTHLLDNFMAITLQNKEVNIKFNCGSDTIGNRTETEELPPIVMKLRRRSTGPRNNNIFKLWNQWSLGPTIDEKAFNFHGKPSLRQS